MVFAQWKRGNDGNDLDHRIGFFRRAYNDHHTNSVGVVRDAVLKWYVKKGWYKEDFWYTYPVVAETYDGFLNDNYGFHVKESNAYEALDGAASGFIKEGNVGGGTGMMCLGFKGGTGTASRIVKIKDSTYTVGVLVQSNFGGKRNFSIAGVPVGKELQDTLNYEFKAPPSYRQEGDGSIIVVVATDAPLLPHQLKRVAARVPLGVGIVGGRGENGSGDIFIAFSTANPSAIQRDQFTKLDELPNDLINPIFDATVQAVEEAIINAMVAAETMEGINGNKAYALPHNLVKDILKKYNRTVTPVQTIAISSAALDQYLGTYSTKEMPLKITVTKRDNILVAQATGQSSMELIATAKDQFRFDESGLVLEFDPGKKTMLLKQGGKQYLFRKQ